MENAEFQQHAARIEELVSHVTAISDNDARTTALELMQSFMDLHGSGFARLVELLSEAGEPGRTALATLGRDPLLCGLLVLYGVHPVSVQDRVAEALERISPQLRKRSSGVELQGIDGDVVRLTLQGSGHGCGSSPDALKSIVEQAVREVAPEIFEVAIELPRNAQSGFVPLNTLQAPTSEEKRYEESAA